MDSRLETLLHIRKVAEYLTTFSKELLDRAAVHDESKLHSPEVEYFDEFTAELKGLTYGSDAYKESLKRLAPALEHHYANNTHHPEHYSNGISGMDLFDLVELLADWKASSHRQNNGNLICSLAKNKEKYGISDQLYQILENTVERYLRK